MKELSSRNDFIAANEVRPISLESAVRLPEAGHGHEIEECWIEIDGARMRYLRAGAGPPIILLHGLLGYSFSWRYTIPVLTPYSTVYAPDLLGAGFSDRPGGIDHSMSGTARRVLQFAKKLGLSSFDLLGTSRGGAVAMSAAAQSLQWASARGSAPEDSPRVRRLILVAPVNPYSSQGKWIAPFFGSRAGAALFRSAIARMTFLYPYWHARMYGDRARIPPGTLAGYMAPLAIPGLFEHGLGIVRTWTADLRDLENLLPKLRDMPTLLMWGSADTAVYASSAPRLAQHFRDVRTVIFPGMGHLPYEECAEDFNRELLKFLRAS